jgi:Mor family transcriptional regulator
MPRARFLTYNDRAYRREKVAAAYKAGAAIPELAERFGLSRNRIYAIVNAAGFRARAHHTNHKRLAR